MRFRWKRSRFQADQSGAASMEFVIAFPMIFLMLMALFEAGWLMTRVVMLERGLDMAARNLRVGALTDVSHEGLKTEICRFSTVLTNCKDDLVLEVRELDVTAAYPQNASNCVDRSDRTIKPKIEFSSAPSQITFLRACMVIDPILPGVGLGLRLPKDISGGLQLIAYTAFMNEPV